MTNPPRRRRTPEETAVARASTRVMSAGLAVASATLSNIGAHMAASLHPLGCRRCAHHLSYCFTAGKLHTTKLATRARLDAAEARRTVAVAALAAAQTALTESTERISQ